jgi:hypothetical protein
MASTEPRIFWGEIMVHKAPAMKPPQFTSEQIDEIIGRLVPEIAAPADEDFFRGILRIVFEEQNTAQTATLVADIIGSLNR